MAELTARPDAGRVFTTAARVHLADTAPDGRARLDAVARWLQDAAYDDVLDGGAAEDGAWIVRSAELHVGRLPRLGEVLAVQTWCDGLGRTRLWARRRTSVTGDGGARVEAVATWVHLDPASGRPRPLSDAQLALWQASTGGREVRARLGHPAVEVDAVRTPWTFRRADLDVAGHVNNAAYWEVVAEATQPDEPLFAEIEHRAAAPAGPATVARDGAMTWICDAQGEVCASILLGPGRTL